MINYDVGLWYKSFASDNQWKGNSNNLNYQLFVKNLEIDDDSFDEIQPKEIEI